MSREPDAEGGPELGDGPPADGFDAIVAGWLRDGDVPQWPDEPPDEPPGGPATLSLPVQEPDPPDEERSPAAEPQGTVQPAAEPGSPAGPSSAAASQQHPAPDSSPAYGPGPTKSSGSGPAEPADEHFIPPEPPPLPRPGPPILVGMALLALGLVLVVAPDWVGVPGIYGLPLGLVVLASGLGWLVLRLWPDPPSDSDGDAPEDGAVI